MPLRNAPAGSENPAGFHRVPAGGENPAGFHPIANLTPILAENQRQAGRTPPYGGCASPSGAQCRHKGVFCLPGTMPDWGEMNKR
ncbi:MAG: hypothetical protein LBK61_04170 [Spirochaetaceae bacterium]|nr:hypothetical protein [Spirochaetaceae bacterium]